MSDNLIARLRNAEPCGIDRCKEMSIRGGCLCETAAAALEAAEARVVLQNRQIIELTDKALRAEAAERQLAEAERERDGYCNLAHERTAECADLCALGKAMRDAQRAFYATPSADVTCEFEAMLAAEYAFDRALEAAPAPQGDNAGLIDHVGVKINGVLYVRLDDVRPLRAALEALETFVRSIAYGPPHIIEYNTYINSLVDKAQALCPRDKEDDD